MKTKKEWRAQLMTQRNTLTAQERLQKSEAVAQHYLLLAEQERPAVVHLFLPIPSKLEVDTSILLKRLNEEFPNTKTVTSVIAEDNLSLLTIEVKHTTPLQLNAWGIPEPITRIPFPEQEISEVLTPLLAVDTEGYRLGYGKGFYDRFFAICPANVKRTGLHFFPPVTILLPKDEWDVPLHRLVYADGVVPLSK